MGTLSEKNSTLTTSTTHQRRCLLLPAFFCLHLSILPLSPQAREALPSSSPCLLLLHLSTSSGTPPFTCARPSSSSSPSLFLSPSLHTTSLSSGERATLSSGERGLLLLSILLPFTCPLPPPPHLPAVSFSGTGAFLSAPLHKCSNNFFFSLFLFYSLPSPSFLPKLPQVFKPLPSSLHLSAPPRPLTPSS